MCEVKATLTTVPGFITMALNMLKRAVTGNWSCNTFGTVIKLQALADSVGIGQTASLSRDRWVVWHTVF